MITVLHLLHLLDPFDLFIKVATQKFFENSKKRVESKTLNLLSPCAFQGFIDSNSKILDFAIISKCYYIYFFH